MNDFQKLGYVKVGQFYVKLIGYGAVVINPVELVIKSLFKCGTTGEIMIWDSKPISAENPLPEIVEFETYNVKSTVRFHGPMTELLEP